jgi:iron(III) transport system substrate-binding protein
MRWASWFCLLCVACRLEWGASKGSEAQNEGGEVMVYTSAYPPVVSALDALAKRDLAGVEVRWFQAGSEKLASRLDAEILAGNPGADLLVSSDPVYYERLKGAGALVPYASVRALRLERSFVDPDGAYVACRLSAMGLVYIEGTERPTRFSDLLTDRFRAKVTLPDPLGSGTMFSTLLVLAEHDPDVARAFRKNGATSSGGGTAVVDRLQRGEASAGIALVENALMAMSGRVRFVVPEEGAVVIPGGLAIVNGTKRAAAAKRVYDFILGEAAQRVFTDHHLHSPFADIPPPRGAPSLAELRAAPADWAARAKDAERVRAAWAKAYKE